MEVLACFRPGFLNCTNTAPKRSSIINFYVSERSSIIIFSVSERHRWAVVG